MMYAVQVTLSWNGDNNTRRSVSLPTFYLDETVQGIVSEAHARNIVETIFTDIAYIYAGPVARDVVINTSVVKMENA